MTKMIAGQNPEWSSTEVYLDGNKLPYCFEADDETGKAYCHKLVNGLPTDDYEVFTGKIEFRPVDTTGSAEHVYTWSNPNAIYSDNIAPEYLYSGILTSPRDAHEFHMETASVNMEGYAFTKDNSVELTITATAADFMKAAEEILRRLKELGLLQQ